MTGRVSVIPPCGDQRWFSRRLLRTVLLCCLTADVLLVAAAIKVLS